MPHRCMSKKEHLTRFHTFFPVSGRVLLVVHFSVACIDSPAYFSLTHLALITCTLVVFPVFERMGTTIVSWQQ